jgi:hypothetical protein
MKEEELKKLVEKYYSGESTEEEESALRDFFRNGQVPEGYEAEKEIFSYYTGAEEIPEPSIDFEARILAGIDASDKVAVSHRTKRYLFAILSAAAGILLIAGSYYFFIQRTDSVDTYSNPQIAYAETIKILRDVSSRLNHGAQVLEPVGLINEMKAKSFKTINKSTRLVEKNLQNLDYLQNSNNISRSQAKKIINK